MFKASILSRRFYATKPELALIHRDQRVRNRCIPPNNMMNPKVTARAIGLAPALSYAIDGGELFHEAAAVLKQRDFLFRQGCVATDESDSGDHDFYKYMSPFKKELILGSGAFVNFMLPSRRFDDVKPGYMADLLLCARTRLRMQYDFTRAEETLVSLVTSDAWEKNYDEKDGLTGNAQLFMSWFADRQVEFGSKWLVIVDEPTMQRQFPDLVYGGQVLMGNNP